MRSRAYRRWILGVLLVGIAGLAKADEPEGSSLLASVLNDAPQEKRDIPRLPESSGPAMPRERLSIGFNYTGGQVRWNFSPRWAAEGRFQFGNADSDYGRVHAQVFGVRGYRFFPIHNRPVFLWYVGGEAAYAQASADNSSYKTKGIATGGFGGVEYRVLKRLSLAADIGPYVISLKESQTGLSNTGLDFVINTALIFHLF